MKPRNINTGKATKPQKQSSLLTFFSGTSTPLKDEAEQEQPCQDHLSSVSTQPKKLPNRLQSNRFASRSSISSTAITTTTSTADNTNDSDDEYPSSAMVVTPKAATPTTEMKMGLTIEEDEAEDRSTSSDDGDHDATSKNSMESDDPQDDNNEQDEGLSAYEQLRLRNIARNNTRLQELGLWNEEHQQRRQRESTASSSSSRKRLKPKTASSTTTNAVRRRASKRLRNQNQQQQQQSEGMMERDHYYHGVQMAPTQTTWSSSSSITSNHQNIVNDNDEAAAEPQFLDESPLLRYDINQQQQQQKPDSRSKKNTTQELPEEDEIPSLETTGTRLVAPKGLTAIYSLSFWKQDFSSVSTTTATMTTPPSPPARWLVGAGKSGIVALWDCDSTSSSEEGEHCIEPILSWKAHQGRWISSACLLANATGTSCSTGAAAEARSCSTTPKHLITAANDGCVCLWDLQHCTSSSSYSGSGGSPLLLQQSTKVWHTSGIFAMDVHQQDEPSCKIATGSKDKTVAVSSLHQLTVDGGRHLPLWRSTFHSAKVNAVQWQQHECGTSSPLLGSTSDDGYVVLHDYRSTHTVAELSHAHARPHSMVWDPYAEHRFLTAGLDSSMKLWDFRSCKQPLCILQGHVPSNVGRCKRIHHPTFYNLWCKNSAASGRDVNAILRKPFVLSGGESSEALSLFQYDRKTPQNSCLHSRGNIPDGGDVGSIAVSGPVVASSTSDGDVLLLRPRFKTSMI